jgi:hypothetical protein
MPNPTHSHGYPSEQSFNLPSKYKHTQPVKVSFFGQAIFPHCWIHKVHFSESKVFYDVNVAMGVNGKTETFRLYNVESDFVFDRD